jgi:SAM-dependent methyltransferase
VCVEVIHGDARDIKLPRETFDFVTARMVWLTVPQPEQIVAAAFPLVRPGGIIAFHEADFVSHVCDPPLQAWSRLLHVLDLYARLNGIDLHVARRIPWLLRDEGAVDIQMKPDVLAYPRGHVRQAGLLDFANKFSARLVAQAVITLVELGDLKKKLAQHVADPQTLIISHLFLHAWDHKPETTDGRRTTART